MTSRTTGYVGTVDVGAFVEGDERCLAEGLPTVRVGVVDHPALSRGIAQHQTGPETLAARARGWATVRRPSGGVGLYHAVGDLVWSIVLPRRDHRVGRDFSTAFGRLGQGVSEFAARLGLAGGWAPASAELPSYCLLSGRGQTWQVGHRAIAGAAQHATRTALLHHGVICVTLDPTAIAAVFAAPRETVVRHLAGLRTLGIDASSETIARQLTSELERYVLGTET